MCFKRYITSNQDNKSMKPAQCAGFMCDRLSEINLTKLL